MPQIKHVVHLMLENRSLDNVLGWLYADTNNRPPVNLIDVQNPPVYNGLETTFYNLDAENNQHFVGTTPAGNTTIPPLDPQEIFQHVHTQCYTPLQGGPPAASPEMGGFYLDYANSFAGPVGSADDIMMAYPPESLPVLNGLARNYAVCDKWFASVPSQTFCNRAFAATGNSIGTNWLTKESQAWVNNSLFMDFTSPTHWNVLSENNCDTPDHWMIYYSELWFLSTKFCFTRDLFTSLQDSSFDQHFAGIESFYAQAANGTLPAYSFLEPDWGLKFWKLGINGNDYHPPCNVSSGEAFVQQVYNAISQGPGWNETLLIITFDEHGGTYDHYPINTNATPPWGQSTPPVCECDFGFDTFGVRVPAVFISPWIQQGVVFRQPEGSIPFDHTSIIATVLNWMQVDPDKWNLGERVANAPTFEGILNLTTPRTDLSDIQIKANPSNDATQTMPVSDLQMLITARAWRHAADLNKHL
ncbi:alkaline phosphatase family protein [Chitinophaga sp. SYP-B3965]|uniref:alkaline phosphatase family protein n=1 Tax=Chitinophaga sp. SYP-B3965 TaxID=2663120 RepID=UPI0015677774|nr:alkaline phosphatase family protein [Chitinophaga sp. SYP-B3965]